MKGIFTGTLAVVMAVVFSVGIAHGRPLKAESKTIAPATQTLRPIKQAAPTEEDQGLAMACATCPSPNPGCMPACARQVVGRVLSITSNTDLGSGCFVDFQMKGVKLISPITPNQNEPNVNGTFNALCNRLALTLINGQNVQVGIAPIKTGEAYLYSVTLFLTPDPESITYAKNLLEILIDLTVDEFYHPTGAILPSN